MSPQPNVQPTRPNQLPTLTSMHPQLNIDQPSELPYHAPYNEPSALSNFAPADNQTNPNSYADNLAYVDSLNKEDKYA